MAKTKRLQLGEETEEQENKRILEAYRQLAIIQKGKRPSALSDFYNLLRSPMGEAPPPPSFIPKMPEIPETPAGELPGQSWLRTTMQPQQPQETQVVEPPKPPPPKPEVVNWFAQFYDAYQSGNKKAMADIVGNYLQENGYDNMAQTMIAMLMEKPGAGGITAYQSAQLGQQQQALDFAKQQEANKLRNQLAELQMQQSQMQGTAAQSMLSTYGQLAPYGVPEGQEYMSGWEPEGTLIQLGRSLGLNEQPRRVGRIPIPIYAPQQAIQPGIIQALATQGQMVR